MIFIVLGTQKFQLNRLLIKIDNLISENKIIEEVFAQIGHSDYQPKNYSYINFLDNYEFKYKMSKCDLIITHSGVGSIVTGLEFNKPIIVFPRLRKFGEHVDDHQLEIANAFSKKKYVLCCNEWDELYELIMESKNFRYEKYTSSIKDIINTINLFLNDNVN